MLGLRRCRRFLFDVHGLAYLALTIELSVGPGLIRYSKYPNGSQAMMHSDVVFPHVIETGATVPVGDAGTAYIPSCFDVGGGGRRRSEGVPPVTRDPATRSVGRAS